jgi:CBS domain containing-hemolysin-like protein
MLVIALVLWLGFVWLPAREATRAGVWVAQQCAPLFAKILEYLHPVLVKFQRFVARNRPVSIHTGLYDKDDLKELFDRQKVQSDNRVDAQTLEIVAHALSFGDKKVSDILTPRRVVKAVSATDAIGPIVMDDLHKSGHSRFPVYEGKQDNIVGVLFLRDAVRAKTGGILQKVMSKTVCYVHEDQPLTEALQAILKTHQQLFVVVNSFEEYVGIVTIEDIMEAIVGTQIVDEFDEYEDLRAVAAKMAAKEHEEHIEHDSPHENIQEVTEVIE